MHTKQDKGKSSSSKEERQEENVKLDKGNKGVIVDVKVDGVEDGVAEPSDVEEDEDLLGLHDDDHGDGDDDDDGDDDGEDEDDDISVDKDDLCPTKPQLPQTDAGTTLFIRNIPFEGTEDELRTLYVVILQTMYFSDHLWRRFRAFGPLRYARITIDPETERSRGTGFVCFWKKEIADQVIEQSEILRAETMGMQQQVRSTL
jgi:nucleolar protein 4